MVLNAVRFNGPESHVAKMAETSAKIWNSALAKKRKEDAKKAAAQKTHEPAGEPPSKKARHY